MKKFLILSFLITLFASLTFADYKSDVANGNKEYKAGNYKVALAYYKKANQEHPSKQLQDTIALLEKKINNTKKRVRSDDGIDWADKSMFISGNPLGLIGATLPLHFEMNLNEGAAAAINATPTFYGVTDWSTFGILLGGEYNFYFQKHAPNGWFAGPGAGIVFESVNFNDPTLGKSSASILGYNINGHGGYRWIWDNGFLVDVTATLGMTFISASVTLNGQKYTMSGGSGGTGLGASIGYAW